MAIETELKLRIAPEHLARLKRHPFLRSLSSVRATTQKLYSIYFDTPDLQLHHKRMALRLRRVGKQWLQTLKGGGGVQAGLHQRNEWETPVANELLDFAALDALGATHLPLQLRKEVQPMFITDFTRSIRLVQFEGALIELGLDCGEIRAGKLKHPISELELELKAGEPLQLFRLALKILDIVPLEIESISKAEYGYRLHAPVKPIVTKAQSPKFDAHSPVEDALKSMIWSCLFHLQANVLGAIMNVDNEYLHQVRVALRRLRVALSIASKYRADAELASLNDQIGKLGIELGRSREWDVFVTEILPSLFKNKDEDGFKVLNILISNCEIHRQESHLHVQSALQTTDFQRLLLRFGAWMNGVYWKDEFSQTADLQKFSKKIMHRQSHKISQRGKFIQDKVNIEQLHKLRIACKNFRYSAELFASLLDAENISIKLNAVIKLQEVLGNLHDNAISLHMLDELKLDAQLENIDQIRDGIKLRYSKFLNELRNEWEKYSLKPTDV